MKALVASATDVAAMNIKRTLIEVFGFAEGDESFDGEPVYSREGISLVTVACEPIHAEGLGMKLGAERIIFVSKHISEKGFPSLLVHPVGNWGNEASFGGSPRCLSPTSSSLIGEALQSLRDEADSHGMIEWKIGAEVTHHGPLTKVPTIFVEIGSTREHWSDRTAARVVAASALRAASAPLRGQGAVGFGGSHYAPTFTRLMIQRRFLVGHMAPRYVFPLDSRMVVQAFEKTVEEPRVALVDWKGLPAPHRRELLDILQDMEVEVERV